MSNNFTPGLRGFVKLGSLVLPVLQGSTFSMPKNYNIPMLFSGNNMFQFNYVEGLQFPTVNLNTHIMKTWFKQDVLNGWFTRIDDDVASAGALAIWDGAKGVSATASKVNTLRIGGSLGDLLRCTISLVGAGTINPDATPTNATTIDDNPASFFNLVCSEALSTTADNAKSLASFDITLNNNLDMNPELNGTPYPSEHNAGVFTAMMRLVMQAKATRPPDGLTGKSVFTITPPGVGVTPVSITAENPLCMDPNERTTQAPRQMREYNYTLLGKDAKTCGVTIA